VREIREQGYDGGYTAVTDFLREVRPRPALAFEVSSETPPGEQAQVDFAQFEVVFVDEPGAVRNVWLFSLVLGYSRLIWARFVAHQDLQTVLRCHMAAFAALGGVPREILYDRMKTAVIGEDAEAHILYNRARGPRGAACIGTLPFDRRPFGTPAGPVFTPLARRRGIFGEQLCRKLQSKKHRR
jgi:transposase